MLLLEPDKSARRLLQLVRQLYGRAPHWNELRGLVHEVAAASAVSTRLADVTEVSTRLLLRCLGWRGCVIRSSELAARQERSARLADLALAVGADRYLCGTGGATYLNEKPFADYGIRVRYFDLQRYGLGTTASSVSALYWMATDMPTLYNGLRSRRAELAMSKPNISATSNES